MSTIAIDSLYNIVDTSLSKKANAELFRTTIDRHMARNMGIYSANAPGQRPVFSNDDSKGLFDSLGLTEGQLKDTLAKLKKEESRWGIRGVNHPANLAVCLSLRYFTKAKDEKQIKNALSYMICFMYPLLHYKYFRYPPTESIMNYTVTNMSNKFRLKVVGNLWGALYEIVDKAYDLHKSGLSKGDDQSMVKFVADVRTRMNSFMRKIRGEFEKVYRSGEYLQSEKESYDEDNYYEADSNSQVVERITNKVLTKMIVNGPNMKIAEFAASKCNVSINKIRTFVQIMITDERRDEIREIIQALLTLYLFSDEQHDPKQVSTNDFLLYCVAVYKKSNTKDQNVLLVKKILDQWLEELGTFQKSNRPGTINDFRRALYIFFVLSIEANA